MTEEQRHADKRVPMATLAMLFAQTAAIIWWAADTSARLSQVEVQSAANGVNVQRNERAISQAREQTAVLVEQIKSTIVGVERLQSELSQTNQLIREIYSGRR